MKDTSQFHLLLNKDGYRWPKSNVNIISTIRCQKEKYIENKEHESVHISMLISNISELIFPVFFTLLPKNYN